MLFKSRSTLADRLRCTSYTSFEGISTSDHKPVAATFEVAIRTHAVPPSRPIKGAELPVFKLHSLLGDDLAVRIRMLLVVRVSCVYRTCVSA